MTGPLDFMGKGMDLFVGMDRMIGPTSRRVWPRCGREAEADAKKARGGREASATPPPRLRPSPLRAAAPAK
jgi:hypothetical protein